MCSNCGRLLVGAGDFCPYCGFPRPKLTEQLEDTGAIPRVRPPQRTRGLKKIGRRTLGIGIVLVAVIALVVGGMYVFRPSLSASDSAVSHGVIPDQGAPPDAAWSTPRKEIFSGLGTITSVDFFEPGLYDGQYASMIIAAARDTTGRSELVAVNAVDGAVRWRVTAATPFSCADKPVNGALACLYDSQLRLLVLADGAVGRTLPVNVMSTQIAVVGDVVLAISGRATSKTDSFVSLQAFALSGGLLWSDEQAVTGTSFGLVTSGGLAAVSGVVRADGTPIVHKVSDGSTLTLPAGTVTLLPAERIAVTKDAKTWVCSGSGSCSVHVEGVPVVPSVYDSRIQDFPLLFSASKGDARELRLYTSGGQQSWGRPVSDPTSVGFCGGRIVLRDKAMLTVLSPSDGAVQWSQTAIPDTTAVWCDSQRVITYTAAATLSAFQIDNGGQSWRVEFGSHGRPSLVATTAGFLAVGDTWTRYR